MIRTGAEREAGIVRGNGVGNIVGNIVRGRFKVGVGAGVNVGKGVTLAPAPDNIAARQMAGRLLSLSYNHPTANTAVPTRRSRPQRLRRLQHWLQKLLALLQRWRLGNRRRRASSLCRRRVPMDQACLQDPTVPPPPC